MSIKARTEMLFKVASGSGFQQWRGHRGWLLLACGCHHQVRLVGLISGMSKMATTSPRLLDLDTRFCELHFSL